MLDGCFMRFITRIFVCAFVILIGLPTMTAVAQRGSLIEDLFRTVAEAQLQKQLSKQRQRSQPSRRPNPQPDRANQISSDQISVGSQQMAAFAQTLSSFSKELGFLSSDLQTHAGSHPGIRPLLPKIFQVSSQASAVLRACDGQSNFEPIAQCYSELDSHWRSLSFALRSAPSLSTQMQSRVRACDRFISTMENRIGLPPQFDRHALHDKMIVTATYMQSLLDDFEATPMHGRDALQWAHDGRLLRQELLRTADQVDVISYEDITTRLSDFTSHWQQYSAPISEFRNPYFNQRLDRIAQCCDDMYALLWMRPPTDAKELSTRFANLKSATSELLDQLTLRTLSSLDRKSRQRVERGTRTMHDEIDHLLDAIRDGSSLPELSEHFTEYDRAWLSIRDTTAEISRISSGLVGTIDLNCAKIRRSLQLQSPEPIPLRAEELLGVAASLEGSAEYFKADIERYEQYLKPSSYRRSITRAANDLHDASKRLHAGLFDQTDLRLLSRDADQLIDAWQRLSHDLSSVRNHGLSGRRASNLENASQNLAPLVATMGAAFLQ